MKPESLAVAVDLDSPGEAVFLQRIRLRAQRRALWLKSLYAPDVAGEVDYAAIGHAELDRILSGPSLGSEREAAFYRENPAARRLGEAIRLADQGFRQDKTWSFLKRVFSLTEAECDFMTLLAAMEFDPMLARAYGYLNDDINRCHASPWLAACLFEWPEPRHFMPGAALLEWRLASPDPTHPFPWGIHTPWVLDPGLIAWLGSGQGIDPLINGAVSIAEPASGAKTCLFPDLLESVLDFILSMQGKEESSPIPVLEIELQAESGSGKRMLVEQIAQSLGCGVMHADAGMLFAEDIPLTIAADNAVRVMRSARLMGLIVHWRHARVMTPKLRERWPHRCASRLGFYSTPSRMPVMHPLAVRRSFTLPALNQAGRKAIWADFSDLPAPELISSRLLSPAEIALAARLAPAGEDEIELACRQTLSGPAEELFAPLSCPYTWDDIVLEHGVRQRLAEMEIQARLRWQVYEDWGFGRLCPLNRGITALFAGPSGTGKTMAAQVLAATLGMDLYRIDLAGVVNKYIGETEKRLKRVFEVCERANVLLFFDEADALFGQRTQVKDAHDRYANIEIDYLLQRMEQFDGVAILATNRKSDIDSAFLRRIRFVVDFLQPGPDERLALWRLALPESAPNGESIIGDIDWEFLANKLPMTGADIKSATLGAAFLAKAAGERIGMPHILHTARREMLKRGVTFRAPEWEGVFND